MKLDFNTGSRAALYISVAGDLGAECRPGLPRDTIEDLAKRALDAERQLRVQRITAKAENEKKTAEIRVKVATQPTFTRYVFAMPDLANVVPQSANGKLTLEFDQPIKWDSCRMPGWQCRQRYDRSTTTSATIR